MILLVICPRAIFDTSLVIELHTLAWNLGHLAYLTGECSALSWHWGHLAYLTAPHCPLGSSQRTENDHYERLAHWHKTT